MPATAHPTPPCNSGIKALRNAAIVVFLLLIFSPVRFLAVPLVIVVGFVWGLRRIWRWNRPLGISVVTVILITACSYLVLLYTVEQRHQTLLSRLAEYRHVSLDRQLFPLPYVKRVSVGPWITDQQLAEILQIEALADITELSLNNSTLTDACLETVAAIPNLERIFIDSDSISDDAILELERRLPDCRVIAYQRNLHNHGPVMIRTQPVDK